MGSKEIQLVSYESKDVEKGKGVDQNKGVDNPAVEAETLGEPVVSYSAVDEKLAAEKAGLEGRDKESSVSVKIEGDSELRDKPYAGMGKEDLLRFSDTPFWNRFRLISILIFWAAWLALLGAVIGLTIVAPRCGDRPTPAWWQKSTFYQIYVRSFYDSNGDGVGDIRGIIEKLDYIEELSATAILLSSVYSSNSATVKPDFGYEILDHMLVDPAYGNNGMADLEELIEAAHNRSISVIMDFIPGSTGLQHPIFLAQSDSSINNSYWNYYTWANAPAGPPAPNNWLSVYGQDAWVWDAVRSQWFLHQFLASQPEINLRSSAALEDLEKILRFWLEKGVDGFRVINSDFLTESADFVNEPPITGCTDLTNPYNCLNHTRTRAQQENFDLISRWRDIVKEYSSNDLMRERILITDADASMGEGLKYYGRRGEGANLPINYQLANIPTTCKGQCIGTMLKNFTDSLPQDATAAWMVSNQDTSRLTSRFGLDLTHAAHLLALTLPGSAFVYYGDELGMENYIDQGKDPLSDISTNLSRDRYRTPMQWTNETNAGFTTSTQPWLSVRPDSTDINVGDLAAVENSTLNFFKSLAALRKNQESFQYGAIHYLTGTDINLIAYVREHEGFDRFLVVINFGDTTVTNADITSDKSSISVPGKGVVVLTTHSNMHKVDDNIDLKKVTLHKGQGFIAKWEYTRPN